MLSPSIPAGVLCVTSPARDANGASRGGFGQEAGRRFLGWPVPASLSGAGLPKTDRAGRGDSPTSTFGGIPPRDESPAPAASWVKRRSTGEPGGFWPVRHFRSPAPALTLTTSESAQIQLAQNASALNSSLPKMPIVWLSSTCVTSWTDELSRCRQSAEDRRHSRSACGVDRFGGMLLSRSGDGRRRRHRLHCTGCFGHWPAVHAAGFKADRDRDAGCGRSFHPAGRYRRRLWWPRHRQRADGCCFEFGSAASHRK